MLRLLGGKVAASFVGLKSCARRESYLATAADMLNRSAPAKLRASGPAPQANSLSFESA